MHMRLRTVSCETAAVATIVHACAHRRLCSDHVVQHGQQSSAPVEAWTLISIRRGCPFSWQEAEGNRACCQGGAADKPQTGP
jgi:hypothetical protein